MQLINKYKIFISFIFSILVILGYGIISYQGKKESILKSVDEKLITSAMAANVIIGDSFVDRAISPNSITPDEDMKYIITLSKFAKASGVKYIYFMKLDANKNIRFLVSSATDEELITGNKLTRYYDLYESNPFIINAFETKQAVYENGNIDSWGEFRSIYVPYTTHNQNHYVVGADVDLVLIRNMSFNAAVQEVVGALLILLALSPILLLLKMFKQDNTLLQCKVDTATQELKEINALLQEKVCDTTNELREQYYHDTLTNLPNRNQLKEDMENIPIHAIAIVDIDDFKEINDYFGTKAGDAVLIHFGNFLNAHYPSYRLNGDEFALIYDDFVSREQMKEQMETLIRMIEEEQFIIDSQILTIRPTIGLAYGKNANLISADMAMHQAKEKKIPLYIYQDEVELKSNLEHNIKTGNAIKYALSHNLIICHYQPILSIQDQIISKYETLVRIQTKEGSLIYPNDFLKLSQKTKHYPTITKSVVKNACETFANRSEEFSINLSSSDIANPSTVEYILSTIKRTNTADRIVFEILESEGIENFETVIHFIDTVKAMGAKIAIDDFGTGYSSFENILKLNIDFIKIDGSLIKNIDTEIKHAIVVETIIDFARKINVKTIAEYVCSEAVYLKSKEIGIDYAQGYFIGKPDLLSD